MSTPEMNELLIDGARYGDMEDVRNALKGGADVNAKDAWSGKTGELDSGGARRGAALATHTRITRGSMWDLSRHHP